MRSFPLKLQFALLSAALAVLALCMAGAVLLPVVGFRQLRELDQQLAEDAAGLHAVLAKNQAAVLTGAAGVVARLLPPNLRLRYLEVETPDGRVLHRSGNLRGMDLTGVSGQPQTFHISGQDARILTSRRGPLILHLGTRLGTLEKTQRDLGLSLLMVLPVVVAAAFAGGLLLGRRALRPLTTLTAAAEQISAENPEARLPSPGTRDEIARLTEVLNRTFDRLQRTYAVAARFSADASHLLKTPVSVMRAGIDALHGMALQPPEAEAEVDVLLRQSRRLTTMIEDLLLLAQADAGRLQLESGPMDLAPLLERAAEDLEVLIMERDIVLEQSWPATLPCTADPRRIAIILQNLTENAAKYTTAGGRIQLSALSASSGVEIRVANSGSPIPEAAREAIFERFHRSSMGETTTGHGLGLNIARELARAHGGELSLEPVDAGLTIFLLRLPAGK